MLTLYIESSNTPKFDEARKDLTIAVKKMSTFINNSIDESASIAGNLIDQSEQYGKYVGAAVDFAKLIEKGINKNTEIKKKKLIENPEESLLSALKDDFKDGGIVMVDTWEKIYEINVFSTVQFLEENEIRTPYKELPIELSLTKYLENIFLLLSEHNTLFISAGRNVDLISMDIPKAYISKKQKILPFELNDIEEYFKQSFPDEITKPSYDQLANIHQLSYGSPLIIKWLSDIIFKNYLENSIWDNNNWNQFIKEYAGKKRDKIFQLLINELLDGKINNIWVLIIPRILISSQEDILFPLESKINFNHLIKVGLLEKGGENTLIIHDDIKDSLVSYAKKNNLLESEMSNKIHKELINFYTLQFHSYESLTESAYHTIMSDSDFEKRFENIKRVDFWELVEHSVSLTNEEKKRVINAIFKLDYSQISELVKIFKEEELKVTELSNEFPSYVYKLICSNSKNKFKNLNHFLKMINKIENKSSELLSFLGSLELLSIDDRENWHKKAIIKEDYLAILKYGKFILCEKNDNTECRIFLTQHYSNKKYFNNIEFRTNFLLFLLQQNLNSKFDQYIISIKEEIDTIIEFILKENEFIFLKSSEKVSLISLFFERVINTSNKKTELSLKYVEFLQKNNNLKEAYSILFNFSIDLKNEKDYLLALFKNYYKDKNNVKAKYTIIKAVELFPENKNIILYACEFLLLKYPKEEVLKKLVPKHYTNSTNSSEMILLSEYYFSTINDNKKAIEILRKHMGLYPDNKDVILSLAKIYLLSDDLEFFTSIYNQILYLYNNDDELNKIELIELFLLILYKSEDKKLIYHSSNWFQKIINKEHSSLCFEYQSKFNELREPKTAIFSSDFYKNIKLYFNDMNQNIELLQSILIEIKNTTENTV